MKITIERKDLCTKKRVIAMMEMNYLNENFTKREPEFVEGFNEAINQLIEVIKRDL